MAIFDHPDVRYGTIDRKYAERLASTPPEDDGPIWMVNLMHYRDQADYPDGRESTITGIQADDLYAPFGPLAAVGAEMVFVAMVETQLLGASPPWDRIAVVRYPARRALADMADTPEYQELHIHKDAGMAETIIMAGTPAAPPALPIDAPTWDEVPHPPTDTDGPVVVLHVLKYVDDAGGRDDMEAYQNAAGQVALPHGVRIAAWLDIEGVFIGDGRSWDQARFNAFPSRAAFEAVMFDPARLEAQGSHREAAIADTYTMILRPVIDRLHESITGVPQPG